MMVLKKLRSMINSLLTEGYFYCYYYCHYPHRSLISILLPALRLLPLLPSSAFVREELPEQGPVNPDSLKAPSLAWSGEGGQCLLGSLESEQMAL